MKINYGKLEEFKKARWSLNSVIAILDDEKNIQDYPRELICSLNRCFINGSQADAVTFKKLYEHYNNKVPNHASKFVDYLILLNNICIYQVDVYNKTKIENRKSVLDISANSNFPILYNQFWECGIDTDKFNNLQKASMVSRLSSDDGVFNGFVKELELLYLINPNLVKQYCYFTDEFCQKTFLKLIESINPFCYSKSTSLIDAFGCHHILIGIMINHPHRFVDMISNQDYLVELSSVDGAEISDSIVENVERLKKNIYSTNPLEQVSIRDGLIRVFEIINSNPKYVNPVSLFFITELMPACINFATNIPAISNNICTLPKLPLMIRNIPKTLDKIQENNFKQLMNIVSLINENIPQFKIDCYKMEYIINACTIGMGKIPLSDEVKDRVLKIASRIYNDADLVTRTKLVEQWIRSDTDISYESCKFQPILFSDFLFASDIIFNIIKSDKTVSLKGLEYLRLAPLFKMEIKNKEHEQKLDLIDELGFLRAQSLSPLTIKLINETRGLLPDLNSIIIKNLYTCSHKELSIFIEESENYLGFLHSPEDNVNGLINNIKLMLKYPPLQSEILGYIKQTHNKYILDYDIELPVIMQEDNGLKMDFVNEL